MVGRVLIDADGVKMSIPGIEVTTADEQGLAFSSEIMERGLVHASGTAAPETNVFFPALPYIPCALVTPLDGSGYAIPLYTAAYSVSFETMYPRVMVYEDHIRSFQFGFALAPIIRYVILRLPLYPHP